MSLFMTNCVHECSEIQKIILFFSIEVDFIQIFLLFLQTSAFSAKTENKVGREISTHSFQPRVFLHI